MMRHAAMICLLTAGALAQAAPNTDYVRGAKDIFAGCTSAVKTRVEADNPRDRISKRNGDPVDKVTQRQFASFTMDEIESGAAEDMPAGCWASLAGVWQDESGYTLDRRVDNPDIWGSSSSEALALTNGTYVRPRYIVVIESKEPEDALFISTGLRGDRFIRFRSRDRVPFEAVFSRGGERKVYESDSRFPYGDRLTVDVTATGRVRMRIGGRDFYRPDLGVTEDQLNSQLSEDDVFLIGVQIQNLAASRKGYDIVTQDPFLLNDNDKGEIFAKPGDKQYVIDEQRLVPIGYRLVMDGTSGMVYQKNVLTMSSEIQTALSHTFGGSISGEVSVGAFAEGSVAGSATKSEINSMATRNSIAKAMGYSRSKRMAIVVDHPFVGLSDEFVDAVEDARRYGEYDRLIRRFGTHYPYAVTYGAAARLSQTYTEQEFVTKAVNEWGYDASVSVEAGAKDNQGNKIFAAGFTSNFGFLGSESLSNGAAFSRDNSEFFGVGGNGSWNESGWMAGDVPYPILLDLRPVWELLNPMNFPGEPEIYDVVRHRLQDAVKGYLESHRLQVQELPGLPDAAAFQAAMPKEKPKAPTQTYLAYIRHIWCTGGGSGLAKNARITKITLTEIGTDNQTIMTEDSNGKTIQAECKRFKPETKTLGYGSRDPGLLYIRGTEAELKAKAFRVDIEWDYDGNKDRSSSTSYAGLFSGLADEERADRVWTVRGGVLPEVNLRVRVKRKR